MPTPVITGEVLAAGIKATFADAYRHRYEGLKARLGKVMRLGLPSDKLTELYAAFESAPYPARWPRGDVIRSKNFKDIGWTTTNYDWGARVEWHENDRMDDQTKSLMDRARELGTHFASLPERIFFQILQASTDTELLPAVPTAPDGSALYAASRFGVAAGNIVAGTGVTSPDLIRTDFFNAIELFRQFQDTEGQPLFDDDIVDKGFTLIYDVTNDQVMREAFVQSLSFSSIASATTPFNPAAAAISNIIVESGVKVTLWPTQRLDSNNDIFVFADGIEEKAVYQQTRAPLREATATMDNSDLSRDTKIEYVQWDSREGYGITVPYSTVKINN